LKLNKSDGTLTIKGRKHMQWFRENFESVVEAGSKEFSADAEFTKTIDSYLKLNDGYTVSTRQVMRIVTVLINYLLFYEF